MDSFFSTLLWAVAAFAAVAAIVTLGAILRPRQRLPQDFDFEHYKRTETDDRSTPKDLPPPDHPDLWKPPSIRPTSACPSPPQPRPGS